MTISYSLAPIPKWPIINQIGTLAGGAKLYTWRNLNRTQQKAVYQDIGGNIPYTNPIIFDENGTEGPFYWKVDSTNTDDTYFLQAFDSSNNLLWTIEDYSPGTGGGGGTTTTYISVDNLIANNIFLNNVGNVASPTNSTDLLISPGNHQGFVSVTGATGGAVGPDTRFVKNITTAADSITFAPFIAGNNPLGTDVTPPVSIQYQSNLVVGETYKYFQFPICANVKNLESQEMTFTCWVKCGSGAPTLSVTLRQYFGSGGAPSADVIHSVGSQLLTTSWEKVDFNFTVPSIVGKTLGSCGDDATYILINMPLSLAVDISFAKPCLFVGTINPSYTFETYDQIDSVVQGFRTGDIRIGMNTFQPFGWVPANDGTIGSASSNATTRANIDTFPLFSTIWTTMSAAQTYAPMYSSAGAAVSYGASAVADYAANNQISLTKTLGQVFAGTSTILPASQNFTVNFGVSTADLNVTNAVTYGTGTPVVLSNSGGALPTGLTAGIIYYSIYISATVIRLASSIANALSATAVLFSTNGTGTHSVALYTSVPGFIQGENAHTLTSSELPNPLVTGVGVGSGTGGATSYIESNTLGSGIILNPGGGNAHNNIQPTTFMNVFFKL